MQRYDWSWEETMGRRAWRSEESCYWREGFGKVGLIDSEEDVGDMSSREWDESSLGGLDWLGSWNWVRLG